MGGSDPHDFVFSVKAHQSITHERKDPQFGTFRDGVAPLVESGKLACVLAQFPYSFHATSQNQDYLLQLREGLGELPVVVEFRNRGWLEKETFDLLEELCFGFCSVDEPQLKNLMPPVVRATAPVAYVRFHGRDREKWWNHDHARERYDYSYSEEELSEWAPKLEQLDAEAEITLADANNHYRGQSLDAAHKLRGLLGMDSKRAGQMRLL